MAREKSGERQKQKKKTRTVLNRFQQYITVTQTEDEGNVHKNVKRTKMVY